MRTLRLSLAAAVMLALLGGLGSVAVGQDESAAPTGSAAPAELPTGPAAFEFTVERTDDGVFFVSSDARFSGTYTSSDDIRLEVLPGRFLRSDVKRVENEAGAWEGPSSGYFWDDGDSFRCQTWWIGEGAYEGLTAFTISSSDPVPYSGVIFEGDVPVWKFCAPLPAE
jgi:hypothetical protein